MATGRDPSTQEGTATSVAADAVAVGRDRSARRDRVVAAVFVAWTLFVWVGRIRNASGDPEASGSTVILSLSFVVPAVLVAVGLLVGWRRGGTWAVPVSIGFAVLGVWTIAVWVLRAADIALGGDWGIGFVVVHLVLAGVSIGLAVPTVLAARAALRAAGSE